MFPECRLTYWRRTLFLPEGGLRYSNIARRPGEVQGYQARSLRAAGYLRPWCAVIFGSLRAARTEGRSIEVSVSDTRIGIAPADQEKVGLTLVGSLSSCIGARIWVKSEVGRRLDVHVHDTGASG